MSAPAPPALPPAASARPSLGRSDAILVLAGANLTIIQFVAMREFASLLGSNEIVVLLVATGYFLGLSAGYLFSTRISPRGLAFLGGATLLLHLSLPFSARWAVGALFAAGHGGVVPPLVFLLVFAGITPFYAVFLPRLIAAAPDDTRDPLVRAYATELVGAALGLALVLLVTPARMPWLLTLHLAGLVALCALAARARPAAWAALLLPVGYLFAYPALDRASLAAYYAGARGYRQPRVLASEFSPYQRVDLLEIDTARGAQPYLFLNGNLLYGTRALHQHNLFVSLLPRLAAGAASAGRPLETLVVAGGSLDCARHLAPLPGRLRVVEIDATVTRLTRRLLQEPRGAFPGGWELIIDDGKHYLGGAAPASFDVIAVDIPVPSHLQTAQLHAQKFLALARSRLRPGGVFSISLAGRLNAQLPGDRAAAGRLPHRILAGLLAEFRHVAVVRGEHGDFAWASDAPLDAVRTAAAAELRRFTADPARAADYGRPALAFVADEVARRRAEGFAAIAELDLPLVFQLSWRRLTRRFYAEDYR